MRFFSGTIFFNQKILGHWVAVTLVQKQLKRTFDKRRGYHSCGRESVTELRINSKWGLTGCQWPGKRETRTLKKKFAVASAFYLFEPGNDAIHWIMACFVWGHARWRCSHGRRKRVIFFQPGSLTVPQDNPGEQWKDSFRSGSVNKDPPEGHVQATIFGDLICLDLHTLIPVPERGEIISTQR